MRTDSLSSIRTRPWYPTGLDQLEQALRTHDDVSIVFRITNDSLRDPSDGTGAIFPAVQLHLENQTVLGHGQVTGIRYPDN